MLKNRWRSWLNAEGDTILFSSNAKSKMAMFPHSTFRLTTQTSDLPSGKGCWDIHATAPEKRLQIPRVSMAGEAEAGAGAW